MAAQPKHWVSDVLQSFRMIKYVLIIFVIAGITTACSEQEESMPNAKSFDIQETALNFTTALTDRDYSKAYAMLSASYQDHKK